MESSSDIAEAPQAQLCAVAKLGEIAPGGRKIVTVNGRSIGIFYLDGEYVAVLNLCPHQFAPVCAGVLRGTTLPVGKREFVWGMEGRMLVCPWHGWEYELPSGRCWVAKRTLKTFKTKTVKGIVYVQL